MTETPLWRSVLSWAFVADLAVSWILAGYAATSDHGLGVAGVAWILNGVLALAGAVVLRVGIHRADETSRLDAELKGFRDRERFLEERASSLQAQVELLSAMREVSRAFTGETRFEPVVAEIFGIVEGLLGAEATALYLPDGNGGGLRLAALRTLGETRFGREGNLLDGSGAGLEASVPAAAWAAKRLHRDGSVVAVPLAAGRTEMGVLAVRQAGTGEDPAAAERTLRDLAKHVAIALQNPNLRNAAVTDALTGLFTKRHLLEQAPQVLSRERERGGKLSILMTDLDHFKQINDAHGHPAGDQVLKEVARRIQSAVRGTDTVYRYGGEEMVCLLPGASEPVAMRVAHRICREIAEEPVPLEGKPPLTVTISIGVAFASPEMPSWEAVLSAADQALYQAKTEGRNRVVMFRERKEV